MLEAVRAALANVEDMEIVGEAYHGPQVLPLVGQTSPDVVVLDLRMPQMDGLTILEQLQKRHPKVKVVILSGIDEPDMIDQALRRGASAFVLKHVDPRDLPSAIRQAAEGSVFQTIGVPERNGRTGAADAGLTEREESVLKALARGLSNKQIAKEEWVTEQTVKFHLTNIYRKLGVANRTEAARSAYQLGLVESPLFDRSES